MKQVTTLTVAALALLAAALPAAAQDAASCNKPGVSLQSIKSTILPPLYPAVAMNAHQSGTTVLTVAIDKAGVPNSAVVRTSSGSSVLDRAATMAVANGWRWQPPTEHCYPVPTDATVIVGWHIGPVPKAAVGITPAEKAYPAGAIDRLEQGDTYLNLTLGDGGAVKQAGIAFSSNYPDLDNQAIAVMKDPSTRIAGKPAGPLVILVRWKLPARMDVAEAISATATAGGF